MEIIHSVSKETIANLVFLICRERDYSLNKIASLCKTKIEYLHYILGEPNKNTSEFNREIGSILNKLMQIKESITRHRRLSLKQPIDEYVVDELTRLSVIPTHSNIYYDTFYEPLDYSHKHGGDVCRVA